MRLRLRELRVQKLPSPNSPRIEASGEEEVPGESSQPPRGHLVGAAVRVLVEVVLEEVRELEERRVVGGLRTREIYE